MIIAKEATNGTRAIEIRSNKNGKTAKIWDWGHCWQLEYGINGQRKNFSEYVDILGYLEARGW